jgi:hypothetical protein
VLLWILCVLIVLVGILWILCVLIVLVGILHPVLIVSREEIFDNGVKILPDTIVYVWKAGGDKTLGTKSWNETMGKVLVVM